ncbi:MAG: metal-binding protein [Firmicutes bacterium]|nr:metal-binding protein [Bacillota bacterium]
MDQQYELSCMTAEIPVDDYCRAYVDPPRFLAFCRECSSYNNVWSCPPYDFSVEELWAGYRQMRLLGRKLTFAPELTERRWDKEQLWQLLRDTLFQERARMEEELFALEAEHPGSLALLPGSCHRCGDGNCTRAAGQPCRDQRHLRHSLESLGGDVGRTAAELLHTPLLWAADGRLPAYLTLVAALLLPE